MRPDLALFHAWAADRAGNVVAAAPLNENFYAAMAARGGAIVSVEKIVSTEFIRRHATLVRLPGQYVAAVVEAPFGAHPGGMYGLNVPELESYAEDLDFIVELRRAFRKQETAATCTTWIEVDLTRVEIARKQLGITALPLIARCTIGALVEFPLLNAWLEGEMHTVHEQVNLGIAVSLGEDGLIVPVVRGAQDLSPEGLSRRIRDLARRARARRVRDEQSIAREDPDLYEGKQHQQQEGEEERFSVLLNLGPRIEQVQIR